MTTLTQCQQQVLDMLISYQKERGFPPTNQEVATMLGYPYQMNQDESVRLLAHVVSKYIVRLAKVPQNSVDQMSPADLNAAAWLVAGFFLQA